MSNFHPTISYNENFVVISVIKTSRRRRSGATDSYEAVIEYEHQSVSGTAAEATQALSDTIAEAADVTTSITVLTQTVRELCYLVLISFSNYD